MSVTIYDIADRAGVSIATVSRVFNKRPRVSPSTRERVFEIAEEMGYEPHVSAQSLARRKTHVIGAVVPMMTGSFFVEVLRGLQDRLAETDFDLLVYAAAKIEDVDAQLTRALQRGRAAGVLLFSTPMTPSRVRRLEKSGTPAVLLDSTHPAFDSIATDNVQGGYLGTRHLLSLGYTRIGLVMANSISVPAADRRQGYEKALAEAGIPLDPALIEESTDERLHGYTEAEGHSAMQRLLAQAPGLDAVFATSDRQALGALTALREAGLSAPDNIAVLGYDDIPLTGYLGLSTLRQPMYDIGKTAVDALVERIRQPERSTSSTIFAPRLVVRATCGGHPDYADSAPLGSWRKHANVYVPSHSALAELADAPH